MVHALFKPDLLNWLVTLIFTLGELTMPALLRNIGVAWPSTHSPHNHFIRIMTCSI